MTRASARALTVVLLAAAMAGCGSPPPAAPSETMADLPAPAIDSQQTPPLAFEQRQRERALGFVRQRRLADAALAWEVLLVLRPDSSDYRERLADTQRQIDAALAERLARAAQAAQRGDLDGASQQYLGVLALQPTHDKAADALRALERERNKRDYLGKYTRNTLTRRAMADAEMPSSAGQMASRNELEHATLLAGDGEFDDAIALLERRLVVERRDTSARRLLANVYYRKAESLAARDKAAAIAALEKSVRLDPTDPVPAARLKQLKKTTPL